MKQTQHKLVGLYREREGVNAAYQLLQEEALDEARMRLLPPRARNVDKSIEGRVNRVRRDMMKDASLGVAVGSFITGMTTIAISLFLPNLFASAPLLAPAMVIIYGALIGGIAGAIIGLRPKDNWLTSTTEDAINDGCYALVVQARDADEGRRIQTLMKQARAMKVRTDE